MSLFGSSQTTKPKVPPYVKKPMKNVYGDVGELYKTGYNHTWTKPTFANFSPETNDAFGGLTTLAGNNSNGAGLSGQAQDIINRGGFTQGQQQAMGDLRGMIDNPALNAMANSVDGLTEDQRLVADRYRTGMNEAYGTDANYNRVRQDNLNDQRMQLEAQAAKMGRYGGGASQSILAREQGRLGASMDVSELDKYRARTDAAAGNLAGLSQTGVGNRAGAIDQRSGLASTLFNAEGSGLSRMGQAYEMQQQPLMAQRAVGAEKEAQAQKQINDEMRMFQEQDPLARASKYLSILNGAPMGQTQTTDPSLMQLLTGGGLTTLALGGMMGGWGGTPAPAGSGAGSW